MKINLFLILSFCVLLPKMNPLSAQDIEQIGQQKPFTINGGVGLNYTATITNDSNRVPMPAYWGANLNLIMNIYGISIPVTAVYTNGKLTLSNSFNQFGISPRYKWVTLHAGYRQFNYSPFTVSGQTLFGGGMELNPGKLRLSFFYGQLRKAVEADSSKMFNENIPGSYPLNITYESGRNYYSTQASYARTGWGAKIGYGTPEGFVDLIFFKAYDKAESIENKNGELNLHPEENAVLGLNIFRRLKKHFSVGLNGAASIYTYDTDGAELNTGIPLLGLLNKVVSVRQTTQFQWAGEANFNISYPNFNMMSSYKIAAPNFRSMGINAFVTDLSLLTIQPSWSLLKQKLRFNNVFQYQTDNLNKYKQLTTKRTMLNSSVSVNITNQLGADLNYNFADIAQIKIASHVPDSVQMSQKSNTFTFSPRYFFSTDKFSDVISVVTSLSNMTNQQQKGTTNKIQNRYATLNNSLMLFSTGWAVNAGINYNSAETSFNTLTSFGFLAGVSKSLFGNSFTIAENNTVLFNTLDGVSNGTTVSVDVNAGYNFLKRNTLTVSFNYLYSPANGIYNLNDFQQSRLMLSYQYNF